MFLQAHELLFVGIKGRGLGTTYEKRHRSVFQAVGGSNSGLPHSSKPNSVYKYIESLWGAHTVKLELFARQERHGWLTWGNELQVKD
jgi:N6-adenosine-specific RNA methylase IME4